MSSYLSAAISGATKNASYYYNRVATTETQAKELSDKVAGYYETDAKALLDAGINPNAATRDGKPLLTYTVIQHNDVFINPLATHGAKLEAKDETGKTALHHAVARGTHNAVQELLRFGADVNAQDKNGSTPLHYAAREDRADVAHTLVQGGADRTLTSDSGRTAGEIAQHQSLRTYNAVHPDAPVSRDGFERMGTDALLGR